MPSELTAKQKLLLYIIKDFRRKHGKSPTLGELRALLGVPFVNSVVHLLSKLEEKGYIIREKGAERGIQAISQSDRTVEVPIVGAVACGKPLLAEENIEGYITVDQQFINGQKNKFFFLKAVGDSMNLAGIDDGDLVLIKSQSTASPNEKVVALIDDEATIKVYKPSQDYVALLPKSSNLANRPIILTEDFKIQGIVKNVLKRETLHA